MKSKNIYLVGFCIVFSLAQFFFGIGGMGLEFKGSTILMAPYRLYFLNWFLLMFAVFWAKHAKALYGVVFFFLATFIHYSIVIGYVFVEIMNFRASPTEESGLGHVLAYYPSELVYGAVTYLLGNIFIWCLFLKRDTLS